MKNYSRLALFLIAAFILRFYSFLYPVIDWDESLYVLMADSIIEGHLPYVNIWDNKPPGIYYILTIGHYLFGDTWLGMRIFTVFFVGLSAYALDCIVSYIVQSYKRFLGLIAGLSYLVFSLNNSGISSNTELFFAPFVLIGFIFLLKYLKENKNTLILAGLFFGAAFVIKFHALFEVVAFLIISLLFLKTNSHRTSKKEYFISLSKLSFGFVIPIASTILLFLIQSNLEELVNASFFANIKHSSDTGFPFLKFFARIYEQIIYHPILWMSVLIGLTSYLFKNPDLRINKEWLKYGYIWLILAVLAACLTRQLYSHYFLQILPPLIIITAIVMETIVSKHYKLILSLIFLPHLFFIASPYFDSAVETLVNRQYNPFYKNPHFEISDFIKPSLDSADYIFVLGGQPIVYHLTMAKRPTKYVYPPFYLDEHFRKVSGVDVEKETKIILSHEPKFIVSRELPLNSMYQNFQQELELKYRNVKTVGPYHIYQKLN